MAIPAQPAAGVPPRRGATGFHAPAIAQQAQSPVVDLPIVFALVCISLMLPLFKDWLGNARWVMLCTVASAWLMFNLHYLLRPALSNVAAIAVGLTAAVRVMSVFWSPMPEYTAMRAISLLLLWAFLVAFASRIAVTGSLALFSRLIAFYASALIIPGSLLWAAGFTQVPWNGWDVMLWTGRLCGIVNNPNQVGVVISITLPIIISLWWEKKYRLWWLGIAIVFLHALFLSGSRAGMLGTLVGMCTFLAVRFRARLFPIVLVVLVLGGGGMLEAFPKLQTKIYTFVTRKSPRSVSGEISLAEVGKTRFTQWQRGIDPIKRYLVFGQGYGIGGAGIEIGAGAQRGYALHNSFLQAIQENGLVGLLPLVILIFMLALRIGKLALSRIRFKQHALWAGLAGACTGGLIDCCFESWLLSVGNLGSVAFWGCAMVFLSMYPQPLNEWELVPTGAPGAVPLTNLGYGRRPGANPKR